MPGISKQNIIIDSYDNYVEIKSDDLNRKYHKAIEVSQSIDIESGKSNYKNRIQNNI